MNLLRDQKDHQVDVEPMISWNKEMERNTIRIGKENTF